MYVYKDALTGSKPDVPQWASADGFGWGSLTFSKVAERGYFLFFSKGTV